MVHFFCEVPTSPAATLELDEELGDEDVLELELEESESEASEASELLPTFSSSEFEASEPAWWIIIKISHVFGCHCLLGILVA